MAGSLPSLPQGVGHLGILCAQIPRFRLVSLSKEDPPLPGLLKAEMLNKVQVNLSVSDTHSEAELHTKEY